MQGMDPPYYRDLVDPPLLPSGRASWGNNTRGTWGCWSEARGGALAVPKAALSLNTLFWGCVEPTMAQHPTSANINQLCKAAAPKELLSPYFTFIFYHLSFPPSFAHLRSWWHPTTNRMWEPLSSCPAPNGRKPLCCSMALQGHDAALGALRVYAVSVSLQAGR